LILGANATHLPYQPLRHGCRFPWVPLGGSWSRHKLSAGYRNGGSHKCGAIPMFTRSVWTGGPSRKSNG